jgi:hypothetical protein
MIPRIWLINAVLALCVLFVGASAYRVWVQEEPLAAIEPKEQVAVPAPERRQISTPLSSRESAYAIIPEHTLFSPDRSEYIPEVSVADTEKKQPVIAGRKIKLHAVITRGDYRKALIDNPVQDPKKPAKKWVRVGDVLDRLTVLSIEPKRVILDEGGKRYNISFYAKKETPHVSQSIEREQSTSTPTVVNTDIKKPSSVSETVISRTEKEEAPSKPDGVKDDKDTGDYEIISTPFGPVKRKRSE